MRAYLSVAACIGVLIAVACLAQLPQPGGVAAGVPAIVANPATITGIGATTGALTAYTTTATGDYRLCLTVWVTTAGTGTMGVYGGATAVSTPIPVVIQMDAANGSLLAGGQVGACATFHAAGATNIQYDVIFFGVGGSPVVSLDIMVEQIR
jgi:hypothetical protein